MWALEKERVHVSSRRPYLAAGSSDENLPAVGVIVEARRSDAGSAAPQVGPAHQIELVHHAELHARRHSRDNTIHASFYV